MSVPLVSVLIPVFNVAPYVEVALNSVLNQTWKNLEVVIVDDGSTDATPEIVSRLASLDCRIIFARNERNLGIVSTLNRGIEMCHGEYILRMDGDDISEHDRAERKVSFLMSHPEIELVGCSLIAIDECGNEINRTEVHSNESLMRRLIKIATPVSHIWLCRRALYEKLGGYRQMGGVEDYDFLLRMTSMGIRYANISDYFGYRVRIFRSGNTESSIGFRRRKLHAYAHKLYRERCSHGVDSFTEEHMKDFVSGNRFSRNLYKASSKSLRKAILAKSKGYIFKFIFYLAAACISPLQVRYLIDRAYYRFSVSRMTR